MRHLTEVMAFTVLLTLFFPMSSPAEMCVCTRPCNELSIQCKLTCYTTVELAEGCLDEVVTTPPAPKQEKLPPIEGGLNPYLYIVPVTPDKADAIENTVLGQSLFTNPKTGDYYYVVIDRSRMDNSLETKLNEYFQSTASTPQELFKLEEPFQPNLPLGELELPIAPPPIY